jgi:hypothetical protein
MNYLPIITLFISLLVPQLSLAQAPQLFEFRQEAASTSATSASSTGSSTSSTTANSMIARQDFGAGKVITDPEEFDEKVAIISLFETRLVTEPNGLNIFAYWVQEGVRMGIPANTIFLILLTPILAFLVSFTRVVVGLPTLDMLVPIALAFAFVSVGITIGMFVLLAIILASFIAKRSLSSLKIMFYPKRSLSMLFLAIAVFAALTVGVVLELDRVLSVSIFPILILMLLGDLIVSVQLHKSSAETLLITGTTVALGLVGYIVATSLVIQDTLILYPEIVLLVIPLNILVGRYFGLRIIELLRFNSVDLEK